MENLQSVFIFQKLAPKELEQLARIVIKEVYPPEKIIFFEGDRSYVLYVILSGSVRVFQTSLCGQEKTISTLGPGSFFGENALLEGQVRQCSVAAIEETTMLAIGRREFRALCQKNQEVLWKVVESLCDRIHTLDEELLDLSFRDVPYRLLRTLVRLAKDHGEKRLDGLRIGIRLTPESLAGMIGSQPERVARLLTAYQQQNVLRREGEYLIISDPSAFQRSLQYEKDWA